MPALSTLPVSPVPFGPSPNRGRTYKTPISVVGTVGKPTMEEEFIAAQNADLGKRKRVRSSILVDGSSEEEEDEEDMPAKKKRSAGE